MSLSTSSISGVLSCIWFLSLFYVHPIFLSIILLKSESCFLVDCKYYRSWFRCSISVAIIVCKYLRNSFDVKPGYIMRWLLSNTLRNADTTGEKHATCRHYASMWCVSFFQSIMLRTSSKILTSLFSCRSILSWSFTKWLHSFTSTSKFKFWNTLRKM